MIIKFSNITEQVRNYLGRTLDNMCYGLSYECQDEIISSYFKELEMENYDSYKYLIGMLFSDHYKMLKDSEKNGDLDSEEQLFLDVYSDFYDIDDILNYVNESPDALPVFLSVMSDFNSYDYFEKRNIWLASKEDLDFLKRVSPLNIYDYLYYCQKYSLEMLKAIYDDYTIADKSLLGSFETIKAILNELSMTDDDNYFELTSNLLTLYYVIATDELGTVKNSKQKHKLYQMIKKLENGGYSEILSYMDNDEFLDELFILVFKNENRELINTDECDDVYNSTVKKLENIKKYFK